MKQVDPRITPGSMGPLERGASLAAALALGAYAARRGSRPLMGLSGALAARGATGYCPGKHALGLGASFRRPGKSLGPGEGIRIDRSIVIHRSPGELYAAWRNLEWLGRQLSHVESVMALDDRRSHWRVAGPGGLVWEWDAAIVRDEPDRLIGWRSLPGSDVDHAGSVHFTPLDGGGSTEVRLVLRYDPPGGALGQALAAMSGDDPSRQIEDDLRRLRNTFHAGGAVGADPVEAASAASFPASDPPAWNAGTE